jgi:tetratricopeptide (TPR) repeat protein
MSLTWEQQLDELLQRANQLRVDGDPAGAQRLLETAPDIVKNFGAWRYARGSLAFQTGDLKTAVKELEAAVQREPAVPEFRANLSVVLLAKGKTGDHFALRRARQLFEEQCRDDPKLLMAHTNLGNARLALNEAEGALACFDRALKLDPKHLWSLYGRGSALKKLGRPKEALAMLEKILALDPKFQPAIDAKAGLAALLKS